MSSEVLIIEDEPAVARVVQVCLQRAGYAVRTATNGEEGLCQIDIRRPDLILLDHELPGINGLDLLERLKGSVPAIKVVMLTGCPSVPMVVAAMTRGASDFLTKPVDFDKLLSVAGEILGQPARPASSAAVQPAAPATGLAARMLRALPGGLRNLLADVREEFGAAGPRGGAANRH